MESSREKTSKEICEEKITLLDEQLLEVEKDIAEAKKFGAFSYVPDLEAKEMWILTQKLILLDEARESETAPLPKETKEESYLETPEENMEIVLGEAEIIESKTEENEKQDTETNASEDELTPEILDKGTLREKIKNMNDSLKEGIMNFFSRTETNTQTTERFAKTARTIFLSGALIASGFALKKSSPAIQTWYQGISEKWQEPKNNPEETAHYLDEASQIESRIDANTYNQLPVRAQEIYKHYLTTDENYIIADKVSAELFLINKDNILIARIPALFGKDTSERENLAGEENDWQLQPTTPAGRYYMGFENITEADIVRYEGGGIRIYMSGNDIGVHPIYPGEYQRRLSALQTPTTSDNFITGGCINVDEYEKYMKPYFKQNSEIFILPTDPSKTIDPETGSIIPIE